MGRAGRPGFDTSGVAVILCAADKKNFYQKFLYEPFPVESQLRGQLADHINAEIAGGSIHSRRDALDFLTWTYYYRRLSQNPAYYGLSDCSSDGIQIFLASVINEALESLQKSSCVLLGDAAADATGDGGSGLVASLAVRDAVKSTTLGRIASYYYLHSTTAGLFCDRIGDDNSPAGLLRLLCDAEEFAELPVRHNEDILNEGLASLLPWPVDPPGSFSSPHSKAFLLLQARMVGAPLPIADYGTDTKSVLDQALRVLNAMVDVAADEGLTETVVSLMRIIQCVVQASMPESHPLQQLPHIKAQATASAISSALGVGEGLRESVLRDIAAAPSARLHAALLSAGLLSPTHVEEVISLTQLLPTSFTLRCRSFARPTSGLDTEITSPAASLPPDTEALVVRIMLPYPPQRRAYVPRLLGRAKDWGWWLVAVQDLGLSLPAQLQPILSNAALLAVKRLASGGEHTLVLPATVVCPDGLVTKLSPLCVRILLISDCMRGLDVVSGLW